MARLQRRQDAVRRDHPGEMIGEGDAHGLGRVHVGEHAEQPAHRLTDGVITRPVGERPEMPKPVIEHQIRRGFRRAAVVAEAKTLERAGTEVLDHDVGGRDQLRRRGLPARS